MQTPQPDSPISKNEGILSIAEYRQLLDDHESSDERIKERLEYIESLCRAVIRAELRTS